MNVRRNGVGVGEIAHLDIVFDCDIVVGVRDD